MIIYDVKDTKFTPEQKAAYLRLIEKALPGSDKTHIYKTRIKIPTAMKIVQEYTFGECTTGFGIFADKSDKVLSIVCEGETLKVFVLKDPQNHTGRHFLIFPSEAEIKPNDPETQRLEYVTTYRVQRKKWPEAIFYHVFEVIEIVQVDKERPEHIDDAANYLNGGLKAIYHERARQIEMGHTLAKYNDNPYMYGKGQLAKAAAVYAIERKERIIGGIKSFINRLWPWSLGYYNPAETDTVEDRIKELAKAGALIVAEIDRLSQCLPTEKS